MFRKNFAVKPQHFNAWKGKDRSISSALLKKLHGLDIALERKISVMKRIKVAFATVCLCVFLGTGTPVLAQSADAGTTTASANDDDNDDDNGKLGLLGLLGLAGLLGLRRKDVDKHRNTVNR